MTDLKCSVTSIEQSYSCVVFCIPGTGKSTTCVELMKRFVEDNEIYSAGKVLYCAPSNKAVNVGACEYGYM